jgi:hypothetical protein
MEDTHPLARVLPVGPRSVLFGAHQFIIHPVFVEIAWRRLYKLTPTWRQRAAFVLHDLGYLFQWCRDMDGEEGLRHPRWGAHLMHRLFDRNRIAIDEWRIGQSYYWHNFAAGHSRSYAELVCIDCSPLMRADKLATALYPPWLYVLLVRLSGEWREYRDRWIAAGTYPGTETDGPREWAAHLQENWSRFRRPDATVGRAYGRE